MLCSFHKISDYIAENIMEIALYHGCFSETSGKFFETPLLQNKYMHPYNTLNLADSHKLYLILNFTISIYTTEFSELKVMSQLLRILASKERSGKNQGKAQRLIGKRFLRFTQKFQIF